MSLIAKLVVATIPIVPKRVVGFVARRYIAGPLLKDAVKTTKKLMDTGASATIDVLGELVESRDRAVQEAAISASVIDAIHEHSLDSYLSVKVTSLGIDVDREFGFENLKKLALSARDKDIIVRLDMENTPYTDITIEFYKRLRNEGFDNVGIVLQAYLKRSEEDVRDLLHYEPNVRLCKGIYLESEDLAYRDADMIRENFKRLHRQLVEGGGDVRVATHDDELIDDAIEYLHAKGRDNSTIEFQMLLGVREIRRNALIADGFAMRIYVPFGEDWYGYSVRRLKENPQMAGHVAKAFFVRQ